MDTTKISIKRLESIRVASVIAYGTEPEHEGIAKLEAWAEGLGIWDDPTQRIFGFDNPIPSAGTPNHGYEFWLTVGPEVVESGEIRIKTFEGGLYAIALFEHDMSDPWHTIPAAWQELDEWVGKSAYHSARHTCLEQHDYLGNLKYLWYPIEQ